ncbi:hypothetical protein [Scytonema hofmannii]|uniref:competence protein CoiA family protein n=1 Tax=Scytonema hofmannii TaxID=34078 RepID=UPI00034A2701|nr:hypothetical protein [Scytonema hofmannii]
MDYAISMKLGGERVYADKCDFSSYNDHKLRCPVCGEPVYIKRGECRKPHFAHIHATNARQVEQCELRASSFGNSTAISNFIEDRGQRLEIFQKSFLSMIAIGKEKIVDDVKFNNWIRAVKSHNNPTMDSITNACKTYFLTHHQQLEATYNLTILHKEVKDKRTLLQQQIALEAIDYLCVKSSLKLLEYLLHYSIYKLYEHEQDKLLRQKIGRKDIDIICQFAAKVIISNSWIEQFDFVINIHRDVPSVQLTIINNQLENIHHEDEQHHDSSIEKIKFNASVYDILSNWSLPFEITLNKGDFLYHEKQPTGLFQICLEQNRIVLYKLGKTYQKYFDMGESKRDNHINHLVGKSAIQANSHSLLQDRQRICELGKIVVSVFPCHQWIATQPKYEFIAKSLTSSHKLPSDIDNTYRGIVVTEDTATLRDTVLCKKQYLGERSMCKVIMSPTIAVGNKTVETHVSGNLKAEFIWIDGLLKTTEKKMITNNSKIIAEKLGNDKLSADQQDELHNKKKNIKTLLSTVRKHTRRLNPDMLDSSLVEISSAIAEYLVQNNVSRNDIVGMMQKLTYNNYIKLRDKAIIHHNGKDSSQPRHLPQLENSLISEEIAIHSIDSYVANNSDKDIKAAEHSAKKACQQARSVIRQYEATLSQIEQRQVLNDSEIGRLALDMTKYCFTTLELNKYNFVGMFKQFTNDLNNWLKDASEIKDSDKRNQWMKDNYQSLPFVQFRDTVLGQNDSWVALSQKVTSEETEIIAIHSLKYCDCVLMFKSYQLEINQYGMLSHPEWLDSTLSKWGIQRDNIIGYIGIRHPNSKIEQIGIVHKKQVKTRETKGKRIVLWYTELERYQHKQVNVYKDTQQMEYQVKDRLVFDGHILKKTQVLVTVCKTVLISDVQSTKIEVDPEIACFLSLYGIAHNTAIKPSKLVTINDTSKHINVNWQSLTGLKVAPMNKQGQILWHPKDSCPFTITD